MGLHRLVSNDLAFIAWPKPPEARRRVKKKDILRCLPPTKLRCGLINRKPNELRWFGAGVSNRIIAGGVFS